jgi:putative colanic acid biosynthesis acetyltransferase WcaF
LLRAFGARVGKAVVIRSTVKVTYPWKLEIGNFSWIGDYVTLHSMGEIRIGNNVCISQHCYLSAATHDYSKPSFDIIAKTIDVKSEAWVAAGAFVMPGVTIGHGAIIGAHSVVVENVPPMVLSVGNPAKVRRPRLGDEPIDQLLMLPERRTSHERWSRTSE